MPAWIIDAVVAVLGRWTEQWLARPTLVVPVPRTRHPTRGQSRGSCRRGGTPADRRAAHDRRTPWTLGAVRESSWRNAGTVDAAGASTAGRTVIHVDDRWQTGWTIAAACLCESAADAVLLLVIYQLS